MKSTVETKIIELVKSGHELAKELHCAESAALVSDLATQLEVQLVRSNALAAENAAMKSALEYCINPDNQPEYHDLGMGCGVEDHGYQRDGYSACFYGWDSAMERVYSEVIPDAIPETPATEAFLAEVRKQAHKEGAHFVANRMLAAWDAGFIDDTAKNAADIARMILTSTEFMADAPEGDFDRSFADGVLKDIAAQLRKGVQS
ncbi:hypothetical protein [Citrobacter koseri]|uniref:hypothetical protein n=1 Tax=Citrobacter koseri TaxID=545 RepID=UPI00200AE5A2|nr:hypothetical protein [Citrobacter koseri]